MVIYPNIKSYSPGNALVSCSFFDISSEITNSRLQDCGPIDKEADDKNMTVKLCMINIFTNYHSFYG